MNPIRSRTANTKLSAGTRIYAGNDRPVQPLPSHDAANACPVEIHRQPTSAVQPRAAQDLHLQAASSTGRLGREEARVPQTPKDGGSSCRRFPAAARLGDVIDIVATRQRLGHRSAGDPPGNTLSARETAIETQSRRRPSQPTIAIELDAGRGEHGPSGRRCGRLGELCGGCRAAPPPPHSARSDGIASSQQHRIDTRWKARDAAARRPGFSPARGWGRTAVCCVAARCFPQSAELRSALDSTCGQTIGGWRDGPLSINDSGLCPELDAARWDAMRRRGEWGVRGGEGGASRRNALAAAAVQTSSIGLMLFAARTVSVGHAHAVLVTGREWRVESR